MSPERRELLAAERDLNVLALVVTTAFALRLAACGAPFEPVAGVVLEHDAGDVPDALEHDAVPDALEHDAGDVPDALEHDAGDVPDALEHDAGDVPDALCTPLAFPLAAPGACALNYGPPAAAGRLWLVQTEAAPTACRSYGLAGLAACENCREHFACACVAPLLVDAGDPWTKGTQGTGCHDSTEGPYFAQ